MPPLLPQNALHPFRLAHDVTSMDAEQSASVDPGVSQPSGRAPDVTTGSDQRFDFVQRELDVGRQMKIHEHSHRRHRESVTKVLVGQ
jgi:hypothetical protein